ncbi:translation initiation factor 1A [Aeropyrum pernix K1]|uniref:Translation initiation factor 1A n=1 Tax=Aeropyrum pernix (strain ATCC 700893 / DSM 11879 / JCM 9820 / NBRC 100138 / K1) TaxID=272557 RepID=IF1A_AERPE|nr:translation initiation factor aIF-1A [Aeropyrum pernix]P57676.1 RecName: Full=Translation initiation factor 1A; Short=aIF-1A [Aeropyrum pernix K1]BAF34751.1 translation initiation factor 1A [Aeropyrum pernix K1]
MARGRGRHERRGEMPLPSEDEGTMLCIVQRVVGAGFLEVLCTDGEVYMARIPGKMRRRVWMREGDVVLFLPWGTADKKGEVVYRYLRDEVRKLIDMNLLPEELVEEVAGAE